MERRHTQSAKHRSASPSVSLRIPQFLRTSSQKSKRSLDSVDQFGLFRLYTALPDTRRRSEEATGPYHADIVAIHGLGGTPYSTWTHENGKLWLRDFALDRFPGTRIYTFGYDSGVAFSKGTGTLRDFARNLLEEIMLERRTPEFNSRPLVFVCHSMGGIVAKVAVIMATNEPDNYPGIAKSLTAILFLGTPHQGSPTARYASILAKTANLAIRTSQVSRFTGFMRTDLLKTLQRHEGELLAIAENFRVHTANIRIASFVEGKVMPGLNTRVVDDHSAFVGASTERKIPMPGYDHREICRHGSATDPGLKLILGVLEECLSPTYPQILSNLWVNPPKPFIQIPFPQNLDFVGQESILTELKRVVQKDARPCQVSLYGLGGIGKSQVALRFAYWIKELLPDTSILWVFASTRERFEQDYITIAKGLKLPGHKDPETDYLALVKKSLERAEFGKWIMIIDNADDLSLFYDKPDQGPETNNNKCSSLHGMFDYIPQGPNGVVLYTTRNKADALELSGEGKVIHVTEMNDEDLTSILRSKIGGEIQQEDDWIDLIQSLQRVPLAIVQAASFIRQKSWPVSKYLRYFGQKDEDLSITFLLHDFQDKTRDKTVANSIFKTWMITVQQLETQHPRAADVLWMMAFFNNQNIPRSLLIDHSLAQETPDELGDYESHTELNLGEEKSGQESALRIEYHLDEAIGVLKAYSFINIVSSKQGEGYTLHRLVQMFSRYWLKDHRKTFQTWESRMLASLLREFPKREYEDWTKAAQLLPHVQGFVDSPYAAQLPAQDLGVLLTVVSTYLRMKGQFVLAEEYIKLAIKRLRAGLGDDDATTLEARGCLALIWRDTDRLNAAEIFLRSVIDKRIKLVGKEDAKTIQVMMNLGSVLRRQKKYDEAITLGNKCVSEFETRLGPDSTLALESKMSLATTLGSNGQQQEALRLQRQVAQVLERRYAPDHPRLLTLQHDLAVTLNLVGEVDEALALSQHVFDLTLALYGPDHPRTANIEFNLALSLDNSSAHPHAHEEAERHFRRVLAYRQQDRVGDNLNTVQCLRCLALCLQSQAQYENARYYLDLAFEKVRAGPDDPEGMRSKIQADLARLDSQEHLDGGRLGMAAQVTLAAASYAALSVSPSCVVS